MLVASPQKVEYLAPPMDTLPFQVITHQPTQDPTSCSLLVDGEARASKRREGVSGIPVSVATVQLRNAYVVPRGTQHLPKRVEHEATRGWHAQEPTPGELGNHEVTFAFNVLAFGMTSEDRFASRKQLIFSNQR